MTTTDIAIKKLATIQELYQCHCEYSFYSFFKASWNITNPATKYVDNWHIKIFCDELQAVAMRVIRGEKKLYDLCINTPPKSAKSFITSVAYPAWLWIHDPAIKIISASYSPQLSGRDVGRSKDLMASEWYQSYWGNRFRLTSNAREYYRNDKGGERRCTSPRSLGTGFQADFIIADDPNSAEDRYSKPERDLVTRWWSETMWSRLDHQDIGVRIVIQQRIDNQDLTGFIKATYPNKYKFISLPADLSQGHKPTPPELEKYYKNGLMFPARLSREILEEARMTERTAYSGQYLQSPTVVGGLMFKEHWIRWFNKSQTPVFERIVLSIDASFTDSAESCPASLQVWGKATPNYYLLYDLTERMTGMATATQAERIAKLYPGCMIVVEAAANGFFIIEALSKKFPVFQFDPRKFGGKEKRAEAVSALWETGNVLLYDNQYNRTRYIEEILSFPGGEYVDRVDSMAQALLYYSRYSGGNSTWTARPGAGM
jgi:hypothetical protein